MASLSRDTDLSALEGEPVHPVPRYVREHDEVTARLSGGGAFSVSGGGIDKITATFAPVVHVIAAALYVCCGLGAAVVIKSFFNADDLVALGLGFLVTGVSGGTVRIYVAFGRRRRPVHGDANGPQLAWGNQTVNQTAMNRAEQISPGFEAIAQAVAHTLKHLPAVGLPEEDQHDAEAAADEVLVEVTQPQPDRGKIRRALTALKGFLAPVATGLSKGGDAGAQDWAKTAIEQLGTPF